MSKVALVVGANLAGKAMLAALPAATALMSSKLLLDIPYGSLYLIV